MNDEHPIQGLMTTAMNSIKDMVDVNTIVGEAVESPDGTVIIPISKVTFGFASGGAEYNITTSQKSKEDNETSKLPFGGGSGAGVSISPVGFLVVGQGQIRLIPVGNNTSIDRIIDVAPELMTKLNETLRSRTVTKKKVESNDGVKVVEKERVNN